MQAGIASNTMCALGKGSLDGFFRAIFLVDYSSLSWIYTRNMLFKRLSILALFSSQKNFYSTRHIKFLDTCMEH